MATAWIVQHGERAAGGGDPGLTERGVEQARAAGEWLEDRGVQHVYVSPLRRARQTAEHVAAVIGSESPTIDDRLRERMNRPEDLADEQFASIWSRATANRDWVPPFGDSSRVAGRRFGLALADYAGEFDCVAVCTHGGVTVDFVRNAVGDESARHLLGRDFDDGVVPGALTHVEIVGDVITVVAVGSIHHL